MELGFPILQGSLSMVILLMNLFLTCKKMNNHEAIIGSPTVKRSSTNSYQLSLAMVYSSYIIYEIRPTGKVPGNRFVLDCAFVIKQPDDANRVNARPGSTIKTPAPSSPEFSASSLSSSYTRSCHTKIICRHQPVFHHPWRRQDSTDAISVRLT